jgi:hypothetical protein
MDGLNAENAGAIFGMYTDALKAENTGANISNARP